MARKKNPKPSPSEKQPPAQPYRRLYQGIAVVVGLAAVAFLLWMRYGFPTAPSAEAFPPYELPAKPAALSIPQLNDEVARELELLVDQFPAQEQPLAIAADFFTKIQLHERAEEHWRACLKLDPGNISAEAGLAHVLGERGEDEAAVQILEKTIQRKNATCGVFLLQARLLARLGRLEDSLDAATRGRSQCSSDVDLMIAQAQAELELQQLDSARETFEQVLVVAPDTQRAHIGLISVYRGLKQNDQAKRYQQLFEKTKAQRELNDTTFAENQLITYREIAALALTGAAEIYEENDSLYEAERCFRRAVELGPTTVQSVSRLSDFFRRRNRMNESLLVQRQVVQLAPDNPRHQLNLGNLEVDANEFEKAETAFRKAASLQKNWSMPYRGLAVLYFKKRELEKARDSIERAISIHPAPGHYQLLAAICRDLGDVQSAMAADQAAAAAINSATQEK